MTEDLVASPCTSICTPNEDDVCEGCFRTSVEIRGWSYLGREQKMNVLLLCNERGRTAKPV